jgi:BolA family transcriptional regulator, general stress-responsive regulator
MSSTGPVYDAIETKLSAGLLPAHLQVINESHMHSGPATESHFKVILFMSMSDYQIRHRMSHLLHERHLVVCSHLNELMTTTASSLMCMLH